jgi:hypothetical protein
MLVFTLAGCPDDGGGDSFNPGRGPSTPGGDPSNPGGGNEPVITPIPSVAIHVTGPLKGEIPSTTATGTGNFTISAVTWNPGHNPFEGSAIYTASVTLTAAANHTFTGLSTATINGNTAAKTNNTGNAVTLSYIFAPTLAKDVAGISITSPPLNLSYIFGDLLNLSGLVVRIIFTDTTTEDVTHINFASMNISANPAHNQQLIRSEHHSWPVVVSLGDSHSANTGNLTVALASPVAPNSPGLGAVTHNTATLIAPTGGDTLHSHFILEYARSAPGGITPDNTTWQTGLSFSGLNSNTAYRFFARYQADGNKNNVSPASIALQVTTNEVETRALWARTITAGIGGGSFSSVAIDSTGNVYTVGVQRCYGTFNYGNGVTATGNNISSLGPGHFSFWNPVLVKYNSFGNAQWASITTSNNNDNAEFSSIAIDSTGNVYAVGVQYGTGTFNYGNGVTARGTSSINPVLVKYNSSGNAQWARTFTAGFDLTYSSFRGVAIDNTGNVYVVGVQEGTVTFNYGNGVTARGTSASENPILVKYNSSGMALWARTITAGDSASFRSVAIDNAGNVYVVGRQEGAGIYNYGNGVTATGTSTGDFMGNFNNPVLVKYNSSGIAQWARTITAGIGGGSFSSVAIDSTGNVYAVGGQSGTGTFNYGNGVTARGTSASASGNPILVKYNSSGIAQWARTITAGDRASFLSVAIDSTGNVYAVGFQEGTGTFNYGNGVTATGVDSVWNPVLVKYGN